MNCILLSLYWEPSFNESLIVSCPNLSSSHLCISSFLLLSLQYISAHLELTQGFSDPHNPVIIGHVFLPSLSTSHSCFCRIPYFFFTQKAFHNLQILFFKLIFFLLSSCSSELSPPPSLLLFHPEGKNSLIIQSPLSYTSFSLQVWPNTISLDPLHFCWEHLG